MSPEEIRHWHSFTQRNEKPEDFLIAQRRHRTSKLRTKRHYTNAQSFRASSSKFAKSSQGKEARPVIDVNCIVLGNEEQKGCNGAHRTHKGT